MLYVLIEGWIPNIYNKNYSILSRLGYSYLTSLQHFVGLMIGHWMVN